MGTCYILGAGFSKAVSNLPVMKDLAKTFWEIRNQANQLGDNNRVKWGDKIRDYLQYLEKEFFEKPCINVKLGETYKECNFQDNLEALISFIDINMSGEIKARVINKEGKTSSYSKSSIFWNYTDLDELRTCIQTYIYLALIRPEIKKGALDPFLRMVGKDDIFITFNYDLILEKSLFDMGLWKPRDGYGITFRDFPSTADSHDVESKAHIYKLHGSLNWDKNSNLQFFYEDNKPIFPGYLQDDSIYDGYRYQGKQIGLWILPSFVKQFAIPDLIRVWGNSFKAIIDSDKIVVIGYSLPKEDSAACLLFGTTGISEKRLILVDPNADELQDKYRTISSNRNIEVFCSLKDFINNV